MKSIAPVFRWVYVMLFSILSAIILIIGTVILIFTPGNFKYLNIIIIIIIIIMPILLLLVRLSISKIRVLRLTKTLPQKK